MCLSGVLRIQDGQLSVPSLTDMKSYKIVVTTLSTARILALMEMPKGHFTHILIDEAAQVREELCGQWEREGKGVSY